MVIYRRASLALVIIELVFSSVGVCRYLTAKRLYLL